MFPCEKKSANHNPILAKGSIRPRIVLDSDFDTISVNTVSPEIKPSRRMTSLCKTSPHSAFYAHMIRSTYRHASSSRKTWPEDYACPLHCTSQISEDKRIIKLWKVPLNLGDPLGMIQGTVNNSHGVLRNQEQCKARAKRTVLGTVRAIDPQIRQARIRVVMELIQLQIGVIHQINRCLNKALKQEHQVRPNLLI